MSNLPVPEKKTKKSSNLPILIIDPAIPPADHILPCTEAKQSQCLGWKVSDVRSVNETLGLYKILPMVCEGVDCYWAKMCPTKPDFIFEGLLCPLETVEISRNFMRYIQELNVQPDDHVDLNMILDLVRLDLQLKRIDQQIQINGMTTEHVAGVVQKTAQVFKEQIANPLLTNQRGIRKDRNETYAKLLASREVKKNIELKEKKDERSVLEFVSRIRSNMMKGQNKEIEKNTLPGQFIEGELSHEESFDDVDIDFGDDT